MNALRNLGSLLQRTQAAVHWSHTVVRKAPQPQKSKQNKCQSEGPGGVILSSLLETPSADLAGREMQSVICPSREVGALLVPFGN